VNAEAESLDEHTDSMSAPFCSFVFFATLVRETKEYNGKTLSVKQTQRPRTDFGPPRLWHQKKEGGKKKSSELKIAALISISMAVSASASELQALEDTLLNSSGNVPLHNRFRALFTLKALKNDDAVRIIAKGACCCLTRLLRC
jgi:hypothetical protein